MPTSTVGTPVTLITGGSTGIGACAAIRLLEAGHRVVITGRDQTKLSEMFSSSGADENLLTFTGDAADYAAVEAAVTGAVEAFGRLDSVVANAGVSTHDSVADGDPAGWAEMVGANVLGPAYLVRAALPHLERVRGRIVFLGSVAGLKNSPGNVYSMSKWAVTGLAENTRMLATGRGVGVTLIAPGRVDTPFWDGRRQPDGQLAGPALEATHVADAVLWALSQPEGVDVNSIVLRPIGQPG